MKDRMYKKGDVLEVVITDIGIGGEGIGKLDGYTLFIKDAVIGDTVKCSIMKAKKGYAYAHLDDVIVRSSYRTDPRCPVARSCGGCQLQEMTYERQLEYKESKVINNLVRLGGFEKEYIESIAEPIIRMENDPFRYRNKAQYPIGYDRNGELTAGFYAGRTHSIIPVNDCLLGCEENKQILRIVLDWMKRTDTSAYDETTGTGVVRHALIRKGFATGEIMVCLVINDDRLRETDSLVEELRKVPGMTSISYSVNTDDTNVIMGEDYVTIYGSETISDSIGDLAFKISPLSFYQVNPVQTRKLYEKALSYAGLTGKETVWDLYCGIGTISLFLARDAGKVYGVEIVPRAIEDAVDNAKLNGITNVEFYVGKAEEVIDRIWTDSADRPDDAVAYEMTHPDVIVVDPPRKGCDELCINTMLKMNPKRIVYVSCDSATLARDLKLLCEGGYELKRICPCDMFGNTVHVEVATLLERVRNAKEYIQIGIDAEDYYRIKESEKAEKLIDE